MINIFQSTLISLVMLSAWTIAHAQQDQSMKQNTLALLRIVTEFRDLPNGPTYMARSVVDYPREELTLTVENFDYEHLATEDEAQD